MQTLLNRLLIVGIILFSGHSVAEADVIISMSFSDSNVITSHSIVEGTLSIDTYLIIGSDGADAGGEFDSFSYAIEATPSAGAAVPVFTKPITTANLDELMVTQNWAVADASNQGADNQLAGNVNAPANSGNRVPLGTAALRITLDTSSLVAGDNVTFDPNLFGLASVGNGTDNFGGNGAYRIENASLIVVSAVPEPGSASVIIALSLVGLCRRTKRRFA